MSIKMEVAEWLDSETVITHIEADGEIGSFTLVSFDYKSKGNPDEEILKQASQRLIDAQNAYHNEMKNRHPAKESTPEFTSKNVKVK